ncbi:hypothetical protein L3X38_006800 [Prunus dulcis]|uniref:Uncharacterized protein n=1 Tax=Prunus dulcis TaxID=3755 RepID=A0AAD4ZTG8_PRUDU|nr:hypothetical protein L3X38_006800 [Prunus dulcis]
MGSTGIFTCCPSTTPFGLILGPDSPSVDEPCGGTLRFSGHWILTNVCVTQADILASASSTAARAGCSTPPLHLAARRLYYSPTTPFSRFRLLPFRSPLLRESLLLSFPLATKMFQFARLSLACPWIKQQFERLTYSGISGSTLIFNSPKHFVAYYALPRLWVPRYPLYSSERSGIREEILERGCSLGLARGLLDRHYRIAPFDERYEQEDH